MRRAALGLLLNIGVLCGQDAAPLVFDVASVKPSKAAGEASRRERTEAVPGSLIMANVRFVTAMKWAYGVQEYQITGPGWIRDERFDIVAKAATPVPEKDLRLMLQALLAERFKLAIHRQTKEMTAYTVTVAKEGHKLQESAAKGQPDFKPKGMFGGSAVGADVDELMAMASQVLQTPVINLTGLKGRYDFSVDLSAELTPELIGKRETPLTPADLVPVAASVMQKQLGLKLDSRRLPVEMLVIDHLEKTPTDN